VPGEFGGYIVLMGIKTLVYDLDACDLKITLVARRWNEGGVSLGAPISPLPPTYTGMRFSLLSLTWVSDGPGAPPDESSALAMRCMRARWYERLYGMSSL
jgi:hypothetical protein